MSTQSDTVTDTVTTKHPFDSAMPADLANELFVVPARTLTLSQSSGDPGNSVQVVGTGYVPDTRINLFWDEYNATGRTAIVSRLDGSFAWQFTIPTDTNGSHTIKALEASVDEASLAAASPEQLAQSSATFTLSNGVDEGDAALQAMPPFDDMSTSDITLETTDEPVTPAAVKPWTFAVYIAGDNNLVNATMFNLQQMKDAGGTNDQVNIVALLDRYNVQTHYVEVLSSGFKPVTPSTIATENLDTGNPQTFVDFMQFVATNYPAEHYAVVLWGHGGGWNSLLLDDTSTKYWDMSELRNALQQGLQYLGKPQYDVLLFDACLMGQYEVVDQIDDLVDVMVASMETVPGYGTPYHLYLPTLRNNGATTPEQFGAAIVDSYETYYNSDSRFEQDNPNRTMMALDVESPFTSFETTLNSFAESLLAAGSSWAGSIETAGDVAYRNAIPDFVDVGQFAANIKSQVQDATVQQRADEVLAALQVAAANGMVLDYTHTAPLDDTGGVSVYLPTRSQSSSSGQYDTRYDSLSISNSSWHQFVQAFYTGDYPNVSLPPAPTPYGDDLPPTKAASSLSDIIFTNRANPSQLDLYRTLGVARFEDVKNPLMTWRDGYQNEYPRWAPDHEKNQDFKDTVVYVSNRNGNSSTVQNRNLFLIHADGTGFDPSTFPATPTPATPTPRPTTATPTATPTGATNTPTPSASTTTTGTPTPSASTTTTGTDTPTPTDGTPTNTGTSTNTPTRTGTSTNTPTPTRTDTPTNTPTHTDTPTPSPTYTPSPTPSPTNTPAPGEQYVVYSKGSDYDSEIYIMKPNGSQVTKLTNNFYYDTTPDLSLDGSKVVFVAKPDGNNDYEIMVMNRDGTNVTQITFNTVDDTDPVWSPDGTKIAFERSSSTGTDVYVMNADGSAQTRLDAGIDPSWAPDGTKLVYAALPSTSSDYNGDQLSTSLYTINVNGFGKKTLLTESTANNYTKSFAFYNPAWSPNGTQLLYMERAVDYYNGDTGYSIKVANPNGTNIRTLISGMTIHPYAIWVSDAFIAYISNTDGAAKLYLMKADGSAQTLYNAEATSVFDWWETPTVIPTPTPTSIPSSADEHVVYSKDYDYSSEVYTMKPLGTDVTRLTTNYNYDGEPTWSPDGSQVAFVARLDSDGDDEIMVMNRDGTNITQITFNTVDDAAPIWSPDGTKIAFERGDDVYVMNIDGTAQTRLGAGNDPAWSSDSTKLVYAALPSTSSDYNGDQLSTSLYTINVDGSGKTTLLTESTANNYTKSFAFYNPAWSPNGTQLLYMRHVVDYYNSDIGYSINIANPNGTNIRTLITGMTIYPYAIWTDDGRIAYISNADGTAKMYVMNADGTAQTLYNAEATGAFDWWTAPTSSTASLQMAPSLSSLPPQSSFASLAEAKGNAPHTACDDPSLPFNACQFGESLADAPATELQSLSPSESPDTWLQAVTDLIVDGSFEYDSSQWIYLVDAIRLQTSGAHTGNYVGALGVGSDDIIVQQMTIPADAIAIGIGYYLRIVDGEEVDEFFVGIADDQLDQVYYESDSVYSSSSDTGWVAQSHIIEGAPVEAMRGKTVSLFFLDMQDDLAPHALFAIDDVQFLVETGGTPTPTDTPSPTRTPTPTQGVTNTPTPTRTQGAVDDDTPTPTRTPSNVGTEPRQLTFSQVNCEQDYGNGTPCIIEWSYDPVWLPDASAILYTRITADISDPNPENWYVTKSIRKVNPSTTPSDPEYDVQLLPNPLFENNGVTVGDDVLFENADYNGQFLMFRYSVKPEAKGKYDERLQYNNIGVIDYTGNEPIFRIFVLNDPNDPTLLDAYGSPSNYLLTNYPAWRGSEQAFAFLYTRIGDPTALYNDGESVDPRPAPPAGVSENTTPTYDIGYLTFEGGYYTVQTPIWAFDSPERGEGVYYRPSWQPGDSGNLTASYSSDGGTTYDVGVFLNGTASNYDDHTFFTLTQNGYSVMPSWGKVVAQDVPTTIFISAANRGEDTLQFNVDVSGFLPNEQVQLYQSFDGWQQAALAAETLVATQTADAEGKVYFNDITIDRAALPAGTQYVWYKAKGMTSGKETNPQSMYISSSTPAPDDSNHHIYLPLVIRQQ